MNNYFYALLGGLSIGLSSVLLFYFLGRIAGITGILFQALAFNKECLWRIIFIIGLLIGCFLYHWSSGAPFPTNDLSIYHAVAAGFLVGYGTHVSCGCTSGHGISGISRFSKRSIVATPIFMSTGAATVYITRHLL